VEEPALENYTVIPSNYSAKDEQWRFYVNIFDGESWAYQIDNVPSWQGSTSTTISNSKPRIENITLSGGETTSGDIILNYDFYDDDGDFEGSTEIIWRIFHLGTPIPPIPGTSILDSSEFTAGDVVWCVITPHDGTDEGDLVDSSTLAGSDALVQIGNTAPQINTTLGLPQILTDHPNGTYIYSSVFKIYVNYSSLVQDGDSGESDSVFDVSTELNSDVINSNVSEITGSQYRWYNYNTTSDEWELQVHLTKSYIDDFYLHRDNQWKASVRPRDTYGAFGQWVNSTPITIGNSYPQVDAFSWFNLAPTTNDDLQFDFVYSDYDNDPLDYSNTLILWYKNGQLITGTENETILTSDHFIKNDNISVIIRPYDGTNWAATNFTSPMPITIVNTPPTALNPTLTPVVINGSTVIYLNWTFIDTDNDQESELFIIRWTINGINNSNYDDQRFISIEDTRNGERWEATLFVFDGTDYSSDKILNIDAKRLSYEFIFDSTTSQVEPDIRTDEFYVEDENLSINFYFSTTNDSFGSRIQWFKLIENSSWIEMGLFENQTKIPYLSTAVGEQWKCLITPFDGTYVWSPINSSILTIESKPTIWTQPENIVILKNDTEGHYYFVINADDEKNDISEVQYFLNESFTGFAILGTGSEWSLDYLIPNSEFQDYLHVTIDGQVKVFSTVTYDGKEFQIYSVVNFNFTVEDNVAPRVENPGWVFDDEQNPTNITFSVNVIDYGSDITEVLLYYYFRPYTEENTSAGIASSIQETEWRTIEMLLHNTTNGVPTYSITVLFDHNNTNREIIYKILTTDSSGNSHFAYDIELDDPERLGETRFNYSPPGIDPTLVLVIVGITIIIAIFGSIIYVKFIRKPELVGLDKDLVLERIAEISDIEVNSVLDSHTLGIVVSFFDQRHGPIPIIISPEILRDNFTKLVDLSDRSFSGTGFSDDFEMEITSSYDFVLTRGIRTKVMSFGYALERPQARGGQENITANILIYSELFPLVNQFLAEIQVKVHLIHIYMNTQPSKKQEILQLVNDLRKFVSLIIVSYERIYGTTELIEEEK
jgi:hypothetical protein